MNTRTSIQKAPKAGYSLLTTLMLVSASAVLLAGTLSHTMTTSRLNDRNNAFMVGTSAAEAATEKVLARMMVDFASGGEVTLSNNLSTYQSMVPTTNENPFWANFQFSDAQSNVGKTYVSRTTTNANAPYVALLTQYPGLNAFAATYRILSNVRPVGSPYNYIAAVQQDVQMAEIPVFQFAIFYNGLLEFSDAAPMTINGRVHCNSNIYVGSPSSLTFNYFVTASGIITNKLPWVGISSWSGSITYNGSPTPGWGTGEGQLTLPLGGASNSPAELIRLPAMGETQTDPISSQRYFNKAFLSINVSNTAINVILKSSAYDAAPLIFSNNVVTNTTGWTNWYAGGFTNWLTTNTTFLDDREGRTNHVTQIDVGKFGAWISTNTNCLPKWNGSFPFNGIVYVQDNRTTNSNWMNCVRLYNGKVIPSIGASNTATPYTIPGLTVATINPLYIQGLYNCPSNRNVSSTNTIGCRPCSVICDALTILSPSWTDAGSFGSTTGATDDTVDCAIICGNVPSTGSSATQYSGGVHNLTRLLENWSGDTLWLNTSIINLYPSAQATQQFQQPSVYYNAPTRNFSFDQNFTTSTGLPPGTPLVDRMVRATWSTPPPNNTTNTPSPTAFFVPR